MELTLRAGCWIKLWKCLAKVICPYNYFNLFYPLLMNRQYDRLLPLLRKFLFLPNRINKFMNLQAQWSTPYFNQFSWYMINTWRFVTFCLSIASSNSEALGSGTSGSAVYISVCPSSLTPCTLNSWEKYFLHLATICGSLQTSRLSHP